MTQNHLKRGTPFFARFLSSRLLFFLAPAQGTKRCRSNQATTLTNVSYGAQMEAFTASFCAMLAVFQTFLGILGLRGSFGALFGPFGDPFLDLLAYRCGKVPPPGDVAPVWGLLDLFGPVRFPLFDV